MEETTRHAMGEVESAEPESNGPDFRTVEEKRTAMKEFREKHFPPGKYPPESLTSSYLEERAALKHIYPNTLADLGRQGIIKVRVFREDGSSYFLPADEESDS